MTQLTLPKPAPAAKVVALQPPQPVHGESFDQRVPLASRRGALTMALLWITMVTAFPSVLIGFEWYKKGFTLSQVAICTVISCLMLLVYSVPAAYLGAKSGQSYGHLARQVFGCWGSRLVSFNLLWVFVAFYSLSCLLLADSLKGLFSIPLPVAAVAAILSVITAFNNFFGFSGVANFARFVAAPLLIVVIAYTFCQAAPTVTISALTAVPHESFTSALTCISGFVIGFAVWGNEPDYWRYGKPSKWSATLPLAVALAVGEVLFPVTGWLVAHLSGVTEYGAATNFINVFAFGGFPIVAAIVLTASYSACNDANMYGMINAVENFKKLPHRPVCAVLAVLCAVFSAWLSNSGTSKALESITSLNCVFLPTVTVIMIVEFFMVRPLLRRRAKFGTSADLSDLPKAKWAAFAALFAGCLVGVLTSGVIPGSESMHVGLPSIQAWLTAAAIYIPLRLVEHRLANTQLVSIKI